MNIFEKTEQPFVMVALSRLQPLVLYENTEPDIIALKKDILANGLLRPLEVEETTWRITQGNERYLIFKDLQIAEVPVRFVNTEKWDRPPQEAKV